MPPRYPRKSLARRKAQNELAAARVRKPPVPIEDIAESHGLEIRYEHTDEDVSGALYVESDEGVIGVNAGHHPNRQRFTIAHELGHYLLHAKAHAKHIVFLDKRFMWNRDNESSLATKAEEIEANQFAAELLVPLNMLKKDVESGQYNVEDDEDLARLAKRYRVSLQALTFRLQMLTAFGD